MERKESVNHLIQRELLPEGDALAVADDHAVAVIVEPVAVTATLVRVHVGAPVLNSRLTKKCKPAQLDKATKEDLFRDGRNEPKTTVGLAQLVVAGAGIAENLHSVQGHLDVGTESDEQYDQYQHGLATGQDRRAV